MCSCGAPQSGSNITGLVSPGLCGAGCAVQGGEEAGGEEGALSAERAATAEERAVCMACCSGAAPDPRRDDGGKLLGSAAQPGSGCVVQCTRSPATGAGCDGGESAADAVSAAPPWCSVVVGRGHGCGQRTRERRRRGCHVSSVIALGYSFEEDKFRKESWVLGSSPAFFLFFRFLLYAPSIGSPNWVRPKKRVPPRNFAT